MNRSLSVALGAGLLFIAGTAWRVNIALRHQNKEIASVETLWKKNGFPVDVARVDRGPVRRSVKISGRAGENGRLTAEVDAERAALLEAGQPFFNARDLPDWEGTVSRIAPAPSLTTGLYEVSLATSKGEPPALGALATARVFIDPPTGVVRVPLPAVHPEGGGFQAWIVADGRAKKVPIHPGRRGNGFVQILRGLQPGDRVVVRGAASLEPGSPVWIHEPEDRP